MLSNIVKCILLVLLCNCVQTKSQKLIYNTNGSVNLGLLVSECSDNLTLTKKSLAHSAIWTVHRLNDLKVLGDLELGITVYQTCLEEEYLHAIFELFENSRSDVHLLGIVVEQKELLPKVVSEFAQLLKIELIPTKKFYPSAIAASVKVLQVLGWMDNIEVFASSLYTLKEFYRQTRRDWMCVNRFHLHDNFSLALENTSVHPLVILGTTKDIVEMLMKSISEVYQKQILVVPLDGEEVLELKEGTLVLHPLLADSEEPFQPPKILPSPLFFEIAAPILFLTHNLSTIIEACDNQPKLTQCIQRKRNQMYHQAPDSSQMEILEFFKLESLQDEFVYIIENSSETIYTYGIFDENLTAQSSLYHKPSTSNATCFKQFDQCLLQCENFKSFEVTPLFPVFEGIFSVTFRQEPWVYAFISLSLIGIIFCFSIMGFLLGRVCKKQVLEGNPILTILLLFDVTAIYASVLAFTVQGTKPIRKEICLIRALCITLPYTFAFALLLSRTILLATVSREIGFMSHVAGAVQGLLTLFIFAVQCALSLQLSHDCESIFQGSSLVSLMSYNAVLLILLVFVCPMIAKSKRNYCEGKYFTIAIVLVACGWSCWLPAYAVMAEGWKDPILCIGLIYTASIMVGCIFIPRTYLMTLSAARERFTNTLPSLATATSAMDIYRASTQPVYDCVNVAAISSAALRTQHTHPVDFYSAPEQDVDDDEEEQFDVHVCNSPPNDKITRF